MSDVQAGSLSDLVGGTESGESQAPAESSGGSTDILGGMLQQNGNDYMEGLEGDSTFDEEISGVETFRSFGSKVTGLIVQIIGIATVFCMTILKLVDLFYIQIPWFRNMLSRGHQGVVQPGAGGNPQAGGMGGMGMNGGMGGMGAGGYGAGGYGGGMGMGGRGMGMGMNGGMGGMQGGMGQPGMGQALPKPPLVSQTALNAMATAMQAPNGKCNQALSIWAKSSIFEFILIPVLIGLISSGVLLQIGYRISDLVIGGLNSAKDSL
jgi:hypothetical protein